MRVYAFDNDPPHHPKNKKKRVSENLLKVCEISLVSEELLTLRNYTLFFYYTRLTHDYYLMSFKCPMTDIKVELIGQ